MDWITGMQKAIDYIEDNLTKELDYNEIAKRAYVSSFYFQRIFSILCGYTTGDYIRNRRLTLAGAELLSTDAKVIDIALKYGYETPESFSRAFTRFHGITPSSARRVGANLKSFGQLSMKLSLEGGDTMDYRIEKKEAFNVIAIRKQFYLDNSLNKQSIPEFWSELRQDGTLKKIESFSNGVLPGIIGICVNGIDGHFDYCIAVPTNLKSSKEGFEIFKIPNSTFAVFHFTGPLHEEMSKAEKRIFSEWMPTSGFKPVMTAELEVYSDKPHDAQDYEFWIYVPVEKK